MLTALHQANAQFMHTFVNTSIFSIHTKLHMHIDAPLDDPYLFALAPSHKKNKNKK